MTHATSNESAPWGWCMMMADTANDADVFWVVQYLVDHVPEARWQAAASPRRLYLSDDGDVMFLRLASDIWSSIIRVPPNDNDIIVIQ